MKKNRQIYRFNLDTNKIVTGSDTTRSKFFVKIPKTFKNGQIYLEYLHMEYNANYLDTMPGFQIRSSSFGTSEYSDSSDYGIIESIGNDQGMRNVADTRFFYCKKIQYSDIGYVMNNNLRFNNIELTLTESDGTVLTAAQVGRVKYGFLIVCEAVEQ